MPTNIAVSGADAPDSELTALHRSLHAVLAVLLAKRWWLLIGTLSVTVACWAYAFLATPVYRAATLVAPASQQGSLGSAFGPMLQRFGGLSSLAGIELGAGGSEIEEAIGVLESREFTERFIERNNLRPILFADWWDQERGTWKVPEAKQPTPARAFNFFKRKVRTIIRDRRTGLITIQIEWTDRHLAARWANDLVRELNEEMRARAISEANAYLNYLEKEYAQTTVVATREAIARLIEANVRRRMVATVTPEFAVRVLGAALPPDATDIVRPRRFLLIVGGPFVGLFVSVVAVLSYVLIFGTGQRSKA